MKQSSLIPGVTLKDNESLTIAPGPFTWGFTLATRTRQLGTLRAHYILSDDIRFTATEPALQLDYMIAGMRREIEREVLDLVLS